MSEPKKLAIYGGSFNPPHLGHRYLVDYYLKNFPQTEKILIIPNYSSPFKKKKHTTKNDILQLCELNFKDLNPNKIIISDIELQKNQPNYSYETIQELKKIYPEYEFDFLIGEDQLTKFPYWKNYQTLLNLINKIIVFRRYTEPNETLNLPKELPKEKVHILNNELWEPSSKDWKAWPKDDYIYPPVLKFLIAQSENQFNEEVKEKWKSFVKNNVSKYRFQHILKVSQIAKELATVHYYPYPNKLELAGILHDITKQKDLEFHIQIFRKYNFRMYYKIPKAAYHAYSAYYYLQELGIHDEDILEPIKNHTLGNIHLTMGDCIIYSADFFGSEYAQNLPDYDYLLSKTNENLFFGVYTKAKNTIMELLSKNLPINSLTLYTYNLAIEQIQGE